MRIVERNPHALAPQIARVGAALGIATLGDLDMRVDQGATAASAITTAPIASILSHRRFMHGPYSAATGTDGAMGSAARASMRSSMTWRKWRISPCTGHAAASPSAQIVWPSTW